jgi:arginyl-tRNA synthetase
VLRADDEAIRTSRLALCALTARTLSLGLNLIGITTPTRM